MIGNATRTICARVTLVSVTLLALAGPIPTAFAAPFAGVMFEDVPSWDPQELLAVYRERLGEPLDAALVQELGDGFVDLYRRRGYLPPSPRVVQRHDAAGILLMEMREAHVARVHVANRELVDDAAFWALVDELEGMRPLGLGAFDRWLERANGFGFEVRGSLIRLAADSPQYIASLTVAARRWQGVVHVDNRGPAQLGHEIGQVSVLYRWPREALGHLRVDAAAAADTSRLRYAGVSGMHRLRPRGERLGWSYARSESTLPIPDTTRTVDYEREHAELRVQVPLVTRLRQRSGLSLALRAYDLDQFLDDGRQLRRDRIRALEAGYELRLATVAGGRHTIELGVAHGLDGLGASLTPPGAEQDFTVLTGRYRYSRKLGEHWLARTDLHLQASDDRLPSSERFFIGGRSLGGAFDPATLSGDRGVGLRVGLDRSFTVRSAEITGYVYYDHGWVRSVEHARPADDAGSMGFGARGSLGKLSWSLELGVPAEKPETPTLLEDDPRLFFSLTQQF
ncbi:MAG TPA: ShlB/FhaC/HecB family hemolysin secretion/activation protein [Pseudomonadales bacterium]